MTVNVEMTAEEFGKFQYFLKLMDLSLDDFLYMKDFKIKESYAKDSGPINVAKYESNDYFVTIEIEKKHINLV